MTRPALTREDWRRIEACMNADDGAYRLADVIEAVVRARVVQAWDQGYNRGWIDAIADSHEDEPGPVGRNPYSVRRSRLVE